MSSSVLVTGGAGYVGSQAADALLRAGHRVVVLDSLLTGHRAAVPEGAHFVELDLADDGGVESLFAGEHFDAVMHFAARSLVPESMREPFLYLGDNVANAVVLLRAAVRHGVGRFVLSSTANLFGEPTRIPIDESEPLVPGSPYGESKLVIERMLHWCERIHGLRFAALRYFNAAGADPGGARGEDHSPETHLIPIVLEVALGKRQNVTVFGDDYDTPDGTCVRDYIHVEDLASAHVRALGALEDKSLALNLGSGRGYSVLEVIETARRITGHPIPLVPGERRAGDPATLVADPGRAQRELGWKTRHSDLETIIESAWRWHQVHPLGYDG